MSKNTKHPKFEAFLQTKPALIFLSLFNWPRQKIRNTYKWVVGWAEKPEADAALASIAFAESSFFPIPPDPLLIALVTAKPRKYLRFATIALVASVLGGILGYYIGVALFDTVGQWVINTYHLQSQFDLLGARYNENAFITIFTAAFTPIPYKIITIAAGVFEVNFFSFVVASIIGRGGRFFTVATLMKIFGAKYKDTIEKYIDIFSLLFVALLIGGIILLKYL